MNQNFNNSYNNQVPQQPNYNQFQQPTNTNTTINQNTSNNTKVVLVSIVTFIIVFAASIGILFAINRGKSRTIMIYMVGSNLESDNAMGTADLDSIKYEYTSKNDVNVVLIAGGASTWHNDYISTNETSIFELKSNGFEKIKTQNVQNMGDSKVFSDFLNYAYNNYKTDQYELIFWDHGGALIGSEFDDLSNDNLSLKEINTGLSNSPFKNQKLENIIFRTCLNGTIEVASILKDYSKYLVASEEVTWGSNRTSVLNFINNIEKKDNPYDIGIDYINAYKKQMQEIEAGSVDTLYSTYSIVDLSKIDPLVSSLNDFISDIDINSNYNQVAKVRSNLYQYAYTQNSTPHYDMVDLYNLVYNLKYLSKNKGQKVLNNIEKAVVYNWATNDKSRGMSIYFPYNGNNDAKTMFLSIYNELTPFVEYNKFINKFDSLQKSSTTSFSFLDNKIVYNSDDKKNEGDFELELTDEQLNKYARAEYIVFKDNQDGMYTPVYRGRTVTQNGKTLNAKIKDRQLKIYDTKEKDESNITLIEKEETSKYIKYMTNVVLEDFREKDPGKWKTQGALMYLMYDKKTKKIDISSVIKKEKDENKTNNVALNYKDFQYIAFPTTKYKILDDAGNYTTDWDSKGIFEGYEVKTNQIGFKLQDFSDGNSYSCIFIIYDTDNNVYYSNLVKMK